LDRSAERTRIVTHRIYIEAARRQDLREIQPWLTSHKNRVVPARKLKLGELLADGCLLLARSAGSDRDTKTGKLLAVAGLVLDSGCIELLAMDKLAALPDLINSVEKLAVSFGMRELGLQLEPSKSRRPELPGWRSQAGHGNDSGRYRLRRLGRRFTAEARKARDLGQELGIPADYGCRHRLQLQREPAVLAAIGEDVFGREQFMLPAAAPALREMLAAAADESVVVQVVSAFRSVEYQVGLLQRKLEKGLSMTEILQVSAAPGYSEHHSGRAVDLTTPGFKPLEEEFERSEAFSWLDRHAGEFGFRLSYPRGNRHGVSYEPWHWYFDG
jgi:D-alanyl-D-alanine carboxypeptidase